jgi:antitoxin (DNA-binding transcriptional repressor) of toxin-antitoxin stability system
MSCEYVLFEIAMKEVSLTVLRQNLSGYLVQVERGETLRVMTRGRAIADIKPAAPDKDELVALRERLRGSVLHYESPLEAVIASHELKMNR